jgi:hypothetical protein
MRLSFPLVFAIVFYVCCTAAFAHTPSDPNYLRPDSSKQWKTLTTAHFRIHHEAAHKEYAQQMGAIAERVHNKLSGWIGWRPEELTEIIILDSVDFSNGAATPLPYNQFYIYMPTPTEGELVDQNPWVEYVFTHEYVHILHLDMAYGLPKEVRNVFGRPFELLTAATFPQVFAPSWVTEGLAVYGESDNPAGYGRLNNAWYEAEMRMEVQRGLRSLTEISFEGYSGSRWPIASNYLYGAYFFKFLSERYGRAMAINYIRIYSGNVIPWRMDERSMLVFGKPADQVWSDFQDYLRQRFEPPFANLKQERTSVTRILYDEPNFNNLITPSANGDLYFYHNDLSSRPQVRRLRADGTNESLFETEGVAGLDWNDGAGLLLNKMAVCDNAKLYAELYRWKPGMSSPERLTRCGRYVRAAWRPDGQQIAAVQLERGLSRLVMLDANGEHPEKLVELPLGDTLGQLAWSPDGQRLVAAVKRQRTGWNLEIFEIKDRRWQQLTLNDDREIRPHFSKDGREVYFISDHDKVWNLRRINIADKTIVTLSNSVSGIYEAVAMPDDSYRLVEYTAHGQAISTLPSDSRPSASYAAYLSTEPKIAAIVNAEDYHPVPYDNVQDYSALGTMKPRSWVPFWFINNQNSYAGVSLYGADVLGFHQWSATPYLYADQNTWGGYATYSFLNTLTLLANRQLFIYGNNTDPMQYRSDELRYQALLHHSFNSTDSSIYLAGGVSSEHITTSLTQNPGIYAITQDTLAGIVARYDNTEFYTRSTSLTDGRRVQFIGESYDIFGANYHSGKTYQIDWKEYLGLGASHVLYLRMLLANGDAGIRPYTLGGAIETAVALDGSTDLGQRRFMLRGYPAGLTSLTGTQLGLLTAEWRVPLGLHYDGWFVPPVGLGKHSVSLFVDSGDAWNQGAPMQLKTGAGIAWNAETLLGYDLLHLGVTVGVARGFDQGGEKQLYVMMGLPF